MYKVDDTANPRGIYDIFIDDIPDDAYEDPKPKLRRRKIKLVPEIKPEPKLNPDRFWKATQDIVGGR